MKYLILISILLFSVFSCKKQLNDFYKETPQKSINIQEKQALTLPQKARPQYYKDSLREAFLLRAKNVIAKQEGYELIKSEINLISEDKISNKTKPYIHKIRNIKDTLFIEVRFYAKANSKMLCGIDLIQENCLNLLCENYQALNDNFSHPYSASYTIIKRKFSRLQFQFQGILLHNY
jgi:hypothetical protein